MKEQWIRYTVVFFNFGWNIWYSLNNKYFPQEISVKGFDSRVVILRDWRSLKSWFGVVIEMSQLLPFSHPFSVLLLGFWSDRVPLKTHCYPQKLIKSKGGSYIKGVYYINYIINEYLRQWEESGYKSFQWHWILLFSIPIILFIF